MVLYRFIGGFPPPSVLKVDNPFVNCALYTARNNNLPAIWMRLWLPDGFVVYELVTPVAVAPPHTPDLRHYRWELSALLLRPQSIRQFLLQQNPIR
jgi:hypothetical protein